MKTEINFNVGDWIECDGHIYQVDAICLGALNQESVLHLSPVDQKDPDAYGKKQEMFVPVSMILKGIEFDIFAYTPVL